MCLSCLLWARVRVLQHDYIETAGLRQNPKWSISHWLWLSGSRDPKLYVISSRFQHLFLSNPPLLFSRILHYSWLHSLTPSHKLRVNFGYNLTAVFSITIIMFSLLLCKSLVTRFDSLRNIIYQAYENHLPKRGFGADGLKLWAINSWVKTGEVAKWGFRDQ